MSVIFNRSLLLTTSIRFLEREYGEGILEILSEWKAEKTKERWRSISEETGRYDPEYLFRLFNDEVHDYEVVRKTGRLWRSRFTGVPTPTPSENSTLLR